MRVFFASASEAALLLAVTANGRFVAFVSAATNLVPDDTNGTHDVFVRALTGGG